MHNCIVSYDSPKKQKIRKSPVQSQGLLRISSYYFILIPHKGASL